MPGPSHCFDYWIDVNWRLQNQAHEPILSASQAPGDIGLIQNIQLCAGLFGRASGKACVGIAS